MLVHRRQRQKAKGQFSGGVMMHKKCLLYVRDFPHSQDNEVVVESGEEWRGKPGDASLLLYRCCSWKFAAFWKFAALTSKRKMSKEEVEGRHKKELKAFDGEKRAALKKAKALKGKKGKEAVER
jgi:hypothetical protein